MSFTIENYQKETGRHVFCSENQDILNYFVNRHVYYDVSILIETLLNSGNLDMEDRDKINKLLGQTDYFGATQKAMRNMLYIKFSEHLSPSYLEFLLVEILNRMQQEGSLKQFCEEENVDLSQHEQEIYEHYAVSPWLAGQLEQKQEVVVRELFGMPIWGRQSTAEQFKLEPIIAEIAIENRLLAGQQSKEEVPA